MFGFTFLFLISCSPVLNRELMQEGTRDVSLYGISRDPDVYKGRLFILGGLIVETKLTEKGTQIEAVYVPVDRYGYLKEADGHGGRFLAIFPREKGLLDPVIFRKGRNITLAGEFSGMRKGRIDEMEYDYPVFVTRQLYLWQERIEHYHAPYDPWYYPYPFIWRDPWGRYYYPPYWY